MEGVAGGGGDCLSEILKGIPERYQNFVWLVHLRLHLPQRGTNRKHNFSYCYFFFVVTAFCLRFSSGIVGARRIGHGVSRAASCKAASHEDRGRCALVYRGQRLRCSPLGPRHPRFFACLTRKKKQRRKEKKRLLAVYHLIGQKWYLFSGVSTSLESRSVMSINKMC